MDYAEKYRKMIEDEQAKTQICPVCGAPMILRTAKRGAAAGKQFYGCSRYPECKGTRSL